MTKNSGALILSIFMLISGGISAQQNEDAAVTEVINRLFKGMELGDSAMVHSVFAEPVTTVTMFRDKSNNPVLKRESSIAEFLNAVGTPHKEVWHEEIWNIKVQTDGDFAQAWCDYAFYVDKNFSHCGVDAFQFHKGKDGWKLFHLADTRRRSGCTIPQEIQNKYK
jgi:hypothetical protein